MIEIHGPIDQADRDELGRFIAATAQSPWCADTDARLVVAEPNFRGLEATMRAELRKWMHAAEFRRWEAQQVGRPVATAGKTFVAEDGVPTAVVCPIPGDCAIFLALASHEVIELCRVAQAETVPFPDDGPTANGTVIADEYINERVRIGVATDLGWPRSTIDVEPGLIAQTDDVMRATQPMRGDFPPPEFWLYWANLARVWAMVAGRADAGGRQEANHLEAWAKHEIAADRGWSAARRNLQILFGEPGLDRVRFMDEARDSIWEPIEYYGRAVWACR
jgi:hypothetical protein